MLMRLFTDFLLWATGVLSVVWVFALMNEKGIHPLRSAWTRFRQWSRLQRAVFCALALGMLVYAGTKPDGGGGDYGGDGGGTNSMQMAIGPGGGLQGRWDVADVGILPIANTNAQLGIRGQLEAGKIGTGNIRTVATFITSTNTTRVLDGEDFRRGFVMTRIGTDEELDFSAPSNAVVCSDWQAFGAANDWMYVAFTNWVFRFGTNEVGRMRVHSFGKVDPLVMGADGVIETNSWFAPFMASLGIAPQGNWSLLNESDRPSQVWYAITLENTLVVTWQNALLDRDTDKPVSFQVEFKPDGQFIYRYDLSRLDVDAVTNLFAGASFAGNEWTTNSLATNVTYMSFYPLSEEDAYDQDPDEDGIPTIDELFVHHTDPRHSDSDYDGLSDYEELFVYDTNPLDPHSVSTALPDGIAAKIAELDPFSCPEGSTNSVLEHLFYSGTTNGAFAYPQSSEETAVLRVTVSGTGTGRLVVGDAVVPLVGSPAAMTRFAGPEGGSPAAVTNTLLLEVGRGVRREVWLEKPDSLDVAVASDDFLIGEMPTWCWPHGWLAFPHTDATVPCIHDLYAKAKRLTLVHGEEFAGLAATWKSEEQGVAITNVPPVSAEIHGSFPKDQTRTICYTMSHPDYMGGETNYVQTLEFCPKLTESEDLDDPPDEEEEPYYSCECGWSGTCNCCTGEWCHCTCWGLMGTDPAKRPFST